MSKKRLILSAVGAALVAPAAFAQTWDDKVTIQTGARPVAEVVAELAKVSGLPMAVKGLALNDIVFVSLKDTPARVVADKIAAATGSKWVDEKGVYTLTRSAAQERKQWEADGKIRQAEIAAAILENIKMSASVPPGQPGSPISSQLVGQKAVIDVLGLISPERIAAMEPDERVVFSTRPTPMQKALPGGALNVVKQYLTTEVENQEHMIARMKASAQQKGQPNRAIQMMEQNVARLKGQPGKAILIVQDQSATVMILRLDILDDQNQAVASANAILPVNGALRRQDPAPAATGGEPLKFSDRATMLAKLWRQNRGLFSGGSVDFGSAGGMMLQEVSMTLEVAGIGAPATAEKIDEAVRAIASRPDVNEPLDFFAAELLRLAAESENAGIVACIPDSAMQPAAQLVIGNSSGSRVWTDIKNLQMEATLEDGGYVVSPRMQSRSRYERMNRVAAAALVADTDRKGYASLDDLGQYALNSSRGAFTGPLDSRLITLAHEEAGSALRRNSSNQEALAIFVALGPTRRTEMMRDKLSVPLTTIGAARDEAAWLTYHSMDGPRMQQQQQRGRPGNGPAPAGATASFRVVFSEEQSMGNFMPMGGGPYQERTELLPNGLPAATSVTMSGRDDSVLRSTENQDQSGQAAMLSPEMLGAQRAQRDLPAFAEARANIPEYRVFTIAQQGTYVIMLTYADGYTMTRTLQEVRFGADSKPVAFAELPEAIRSRIDKSYQQTSEAMKNIRIGGPGGGRQSPPP